MMQIYHIAYDLICNAMRCDAMLGVMRCDAMRCDAMRCDEHSDDLRYDIPLDTKSAAKQPSK